MLIRKFPYPRKKTSRFYVLTEKFYPTPSSEIFSAKKATVKIFLQIFAVAFFHFHTLIIFFNAASPAFVAWF